MMNLEKTIEALKSNRMDVHYVRTAEEAKALALSMIPEGSTCVSGGSVTLAETGIIDAIKNGAYHYIDRSLPDLTQEQKDDAMRAAFGADFYLSSANAITEDGELYNVDGNSNRVAALLWGAKNVIVVAGVNKLVKNLDEAVLRVKTVAAPRNAARLSCNTPCAKLGHCISLERNGGMTDGCKTPARICANFTVMAYQRHASRVKVILVGESLGY
ncbi:MAG: lactate utilization protein [Clostridia bacterium]|nr:lactate utilization protein [Clostridia bacterium]